MVESDGDNMVRCGCAKQIKNGDSEADLHPTHVHNETRDGMLRKVIKAKLARMSRQNPAHWESDESPFFGTPLLSVDDPGYLTPLQEQEQYERDHHLKLVDVRPATAYEAASEFMQLCLPGDWPLCELVIFFVCAVVTAFAFHGAFSGVIVLCDKAATSAPVHQSLYGKFQFPSVDRTFDDNVPNIWTNGNSTIVITDDSFPPPIGTEHDNYGVGKIDFSIVSLVLSVASIVISSLPFWKRRDARKPNRRELAQAKFVQP